MPGPMPKDPALRQRRNRATTRAVLGAAELPRKRAPRLPKLPDNPWHPLTRLWWNDVWHSPMAAEYVRADVHALLRLAVLVNAFWTKPDRELGAEIRLQQQAFGLTPLDRRRLEWSIAQADEASTRKAKRHVREALSGERDPRSVLKVVGE